MEFTDSINEYFEILQKAMGSVDIEVVNNAIKIILKAYDSGSSIFVFGNGGSGSTASHLVCDFNKDLSLGSKNRFDMICLNDNIPSLMAYANDYGYENIFFYQLQGKLKENDIVIAISGSGNSMNVVKAAEYAKECGNTVITLTGFSGGKLVKFSDCSIHVPINDMQKVEDCHLIVGHLIAQIIGKKIGHPMCLSNTAHR